VVGVRRRVTKPNEGGYSTDMMREWRVRVLQVVEGLRRVTVLI
jgi:hypothetical protein